MSATKCPSEQTPVLTEEMEGNRPALQSTLSVCWACTYLLVKLIRMHKNNISGVTRTPVAAESFQHLLGLRLLTVRL